MADSFSEEPQAIKNSREKTVNVFFIVIIYLLFSLTNPNSSSMLLLSNSSSLKKQEPRNQYCPKIFLAYFPNPKFELKYIAFISGMKPISRNKIGEWV
ncbi:hypothetical protein P872_08085 [Rhodonellum psychrophilum GCM71 = DSM 17998]|uniref:Uncharacterized protein n=1 Tax=Rhodonellum psychrophilum GCM71 = DSM 17998 TaxID=1123057 RepID=U5BX26_9BACT|nr:hypothetical protein P872_08085 [Rhodonellum psychrophilum GCM71 = DSM 17998]